jgi:sulfate adenylyltransferase (ADP) / ATP adenylyltransferase
MVMSEGSRLTVLQQPGVLWQRTVEKTRHALACGALVSIPTTYEFVEQNGIPFLVRLVANLMRKEEANRQQKQAKIIHGKEFNPFLPYEDDLFVMDISETHVCILNKFNVVDHHLLIITRAFEEQKALLTQDDFVAVWACLSEIDGLVFYNGGKLAGASQRHKHLQLVPFPFVPEVRIPIALQFNSVSQHETVITVPELPFVHALIKFNSMPRAEHLFKLYHQMLQAVGIRTDQTMQSAPYNLLVTREWMFIVPRSQEKTSGISVNSLGFAGALLARNSEELALLKQIQPMNVLKNVAIAIPSK